MDNDDVIRATPLSTDEKKLLTKMLKNLKLLAVSGKVIFHVNDRQVVRVEPQPML